jgi:RNA polymerase sigma-32 factor
MSPQYLYGTTEPLTRKQEQELFRKLNQRDRSARDELVRRHLWVASLTARRYRFFGIPVDDLVQHAVEGILIALESFDPARGIRFSTYATTACSSKVQDAVFRLHRCVRIGQSARERAALRWWRKTKSQSPDEMSEAARMPIGRARALLPLLATRSISTEGPARNGLEGVTFGDCLENPSGSPEDALGDQERLQLGREAIRRFRRSLGPRDRVIFDARCLAEDPMTLRELGAQLGVSRERIRQIEVQLRCRLREAVLEATNCLDTVSRHASIGS